MLQIGGLLKKSSEGDDFRGEWDIKSHWNQCIFAKYLEDEATKSDSLIAYSKDSITSHIVDKCLICRDIRTVCIASYTTSGLCMLLK